jgi:2-polyprenyl-3-methyl-5-hydroxy-6-metoxy-1,4-benzoquinol methylase
LQGSDVYAADHHWGDEVTDVTAHDLPALKATYLLSALPERGRALEIGCGSGRILNTIATHRPGLSLHGCDIRPMRYEPTAFTFTLVDPNGDLPYDPASFDVVIMCDVLEHAVDPLAMIKSARAVVPRDGTLVSFTPLEGQRFSLYRFYRRLLGDDLYVTTKEHLQAFSEQSLRALVSSAFTIRDAQFAYHFCGQFMDATLFALLKIPALGRKFWKTNPYYRETMSGGTGSNRTLFDTLLRAGNAVAYYESRALRHSRFGAAGLLLTATAD